MFKSIRTSFILFIIVIMVLLTSIIVGVNYHNGKFAAMQTISVLDKQISKDIKENVSNTFKQGYIVNDINSEMIEKGLDWDYMKNLFYSEVRHTSINYVWFGSIDNEFVGVQKVSTRFILKEKLSNQDNRVFFEIGSNLDSLQKTGEKPYSVFERPWYKKSYELKKNIWGNIYFSNQFKVPQITLSKGVDRGVVAINFTLQEIFQFLKDLEVGKTGFVFIVDKSGNLLVDSRSSVLNKHLVQIQKDSLINSIVSENHDKDMYHISKMKLSSGPDWTVYVVIPYADFLSSWEKGIKLSVIASVIFCLIFIILSILFVNRITQPLVLLIQHIKKMKDSDWNEWGKLEKDIKRKDEVGRLALHFSELSVQLFELLNNFQDKVDEAVEDLRQKNQDLEAFDHAVSHDLKNPIGEVYSFADLLIASDGYKLLSKDEKMFVDFIFDSTERALGIVNTLLELAVVQKDDVVLEIVDVRGVAINADGILETTKQKCHASILIPQEMPVSYGYEPWIIQIWNNLFTNAMKYGGTPPIINIGGEVLEDGRVKYWCIDNGSGITPDEAEKIFGKAVRLNRHKRQKGHGFGLSIVKSMVEKMGGEIGVETEMGTGARFWFILKAEV